VEDAKPNATFSENPRLPTDRRDPDDGDDDDTDVERVGEAEYRRSIRLQNKNNRQGSPSEGRGGKKRQRSDNQRDCHGDTRHEDSRDYELSRPKIVIRIHTSASESLFGIGCPVLLDRRLLRTTLWYRRRVRRLM
jgi:hypothetical protein